MQLSREVCGRRTAGGKRENDWQRFGSRKPSTGWRFGQQQSVLPNVAQRSMRVSVMLVLGQSVGTGGASSVAGELATDGQLERASRHAACRPPAYIRVSFSPLPFVRPKNMHAHIYTCTYYVHLYTYLYISIPA